MFPFEREKCCANWSDEVLVLGSGHVAPPMIAYLARKPTELLVCSVEEKELNALRRLPGHSPVFGRFPVVLVWIWLRGNIGNIGRLVSRGVALGLVCWLGSGGCEGEKGF